MEDQTSKLHLKDCPESLQRLIEKVAEDFANDLTWPSVDELHLRCQEESVSETDFNAYGRKAFAIHSVNGRQFWRLNLWAMYDTGLFNLPFEKARDVLDRAFVDIKATRRATTVTRNDIAAKLHRRADDSYVAKVQYIFERSNVGYQLHPDHGWELLVVVVYAKFPTPSIEDLFLSDRPFHGSGAHYLPEAPQALMPRDAFSTDATGLSMPTKNTKIFIVHGHDDALRDAVTLFIERLNFEPIILHEVPNRGRTITEKLEHSDDVGFAIVLLTPDDLGRENKPESIEQPRARQNVILELGYFWAKLGRANVCALVKGKVEDPSDYKNVAYVPFDARGAWKIEIMRELRAAGYAVPEIP